MKHVLTIAGSDSGGGAGIQADLKTFSALGTYGLSVITAITAQNTQGVTGIEILSPFIVEKQLDAVFKDIRIDAVKIGMVASRELIKVIVQAINRFQPKIIIVDPVMVSTTGSRLLEEDAIEEIKQHLFPIATLITPNLQEAAVLLETELQSLKDLFQVAVKLKQFTVGEVLITGGHNVLGDQVIDVLSTGEAFMSERIETKHTHGTGCSLSSAIAVFMAQGLTLSKAVQKAKQYVTKGLYHAYPIGSGAGPIHHFHALWNDL
ncbi:bifunctional hydroxymethylpyrimidine kinase/phosphomethylpyrimidine kinase [Shimazuella sp. KC615]|uniref:Hydroxymethylpyrimidine/phosphomethylpyrimidine kinase n=1 Tax=Shimazuella alba TaxID=2690964 RepID=A0A6I4VP26_9BACL|nr:bifunctional hydroxymethylpyrimidine kinase/phosphomethylpyrimidine kinase [Shimazuella alba]